MDGLAWLNPRAPAASSRSSGSVCRLGRNMKWCFLSLLLVAASASPEEVSELLCRLVRT